jgi:protein phosphatase
MTADGSTPDARPPASGATRISLPADALLLLVAPAGAGKSTFARAHFRATEVVSSDACRALVSDDEANQEATDAAYEVFHTILRGRLRLGRLAVADATNLEADFRARLRGHAAEFARPAVALVLDVPVEVCQAQNGARTRRVPPHIIAMHYKRYRQAREVLPREGYAAIHTVRPDAVLAFARAPASGTG